MSVAFKDQRAVCGEAGEGAVAYGEGHAAHGTRQVAAGKQAGDGGLFEFVGFDVEADGAFGDLAAEILSDAVGGLGEGGDK